MPPIKTLGGRWCLLEVLVRGPGFYDWIPGGVCVLVAWVVHGKCLGGVSVLTPGSVGVQIVGCAGQASGSSSCRIVLVFDSA